MEEYIREWQINSPEINIVHTKGREAAVVKVTGVMPVKSSWLLNSLDYELTFLLLIEENNFIEVLDYPQRSIIKLRVDSSGNFSYSFRLKNIDNLPINELKKIELTHQVHVLEPSIIEDDDYENRTVFSRSINVNIIVKEGNEAPMPPSPNPAVPPKITNDPTVPTITNDPEKPTVTVTPADTTTPTIVPEATDTNSILLYAGLFVAALVLIKK